MGLMYVFPVSDELPDDDRVEVKDAKITLKTYGLPMVFWSYLVGVLALVIIMWVASRAVIAKLLTYQDDPTLIFLGHLVQWTLILTPTTLLACFFYEKILSKKGVDLTITHRIFFIPVFRKKYRLKSPGAFAVDHFMDSPNMARIRRKQGLHQEAMKGFENKGYFELIIEEEGGLKVSIDRHSRKVDLIKMSELLSKY